MQDKFKFIKLIVILVLMLLFLKEPFEKLQTNIFGLEQPFIIVNIAIISVIIYILFIIWDNFIWKEKRFFIPLIGKFFGFYDYPNLNGEWNGKFNSSYKYDWENHKYVTEGDGEIIIKQKYSELIIEGKFNKSKFHSIFSLLKNRDNKWILIYMYENNPTDVDLKTSINGGTHKGFCHLLLDENDMSLDGFYSNDESRKTRGSLNLVKK